MTEEQHQPKSPFWHVLRIFDEPTRVFRDLADRPRVFVPIVLLVLVSGFVAFATPGQIFRNQAERQIEQFQQGGQLTEEQVQERVEGAASPRGRAFIFGLGALGGLLSLVIVALVLMFIFGTTSGTSIKFKEEFAITVHAYVPQLAGAILMVGLVAFAGFEELQLSLGFLFDEDANPFLASFASQITLFGAWNVYLLALGNQIKTSWKGIGGPLLIVGGLWLLLKVAFALVGTAFGS